MHCSPMARAFHKASPPLEVPPLWDGIPRVPKGHPGLHHTVPFGDSGKRPGQLPGKARSITSTITSTSKRELAFRRSCQPCSMGEGGVPLNLVPFGTAFVTPARACAL